MILQFTIVNPTASKIEHLGLGFFCDLDLDRFNDRIGFDSLMGMMYQYDAANGRYIGLMGVSPNEFAYTAAQNGTEFKRGFTTSDKFALADASGLNFAAGDAGDWYCTVSRRTDQIEAFGKRKMAIALAAGTTLSDLRTAMQSALNEYSLYLDVDDQQAALPTTMELDQNYPNPFNPQTTISFALNSAQMSRLDVYNVTGQKVRTLLDAQVQAGRHDIVWDGHDDTGRVVASGIYFYRLTTAEESQSRKMVFLK